MTTRRYAVALMAGTLLSGAAAAALGTLGPSAGFPHLTGRQPWADYRTLAGAPFGSAMQLFALTAVIYAACLLAAGLLDRRHARAAQPDTPASEVPERDHEDRSVPC